MNEATLDSRSLQLILTPSELQNPLDGYCLKSPGLDDSGVVASSLIVMKINRLNSFPRRRLPFGRGQKTRP